MHSFKKAAGFVLAFAVFAALVSAVIIFPYARGEVYFYQDAGVRRGCAGTLDTLYLGSSFSYRAFAPEVTDPVMGTCSYNLSGAMMTMEGRMALLKKELERNPVKKVYIELSLFTLNRDRVSEGPEGDIYVLGRLDNIFEKAGYFFSAIRPAEYFQVYRDSLDRGLHGWKNIVTGEKTAIRQYESRGWVPVESHDVSLKPGEYAGIADSKEIDAKKFEENLSLLREMITLCREKGTEVELVAAPISARAVIEYKNLDAIHSSLAEFALKEGLKYNDYSLYRDGFRIWDDSSAFFDRHHLSESGALAFSRVFAEAELCGGEFYGSYGELREALTAGMAE